MSFDVLPDNLGSGREEFPLTCYIVGGTQAEKAQANCVIDMKLSNLCKTQKSSESDEEDSDRFVDKNHLRNSVKKGSDILSCLNRRIAGSVMYSLMTDLLILITVLAQ